MLDAESISASLARDDRVRRQVRRTRRFRATEPGAGENLSVHLDLEKATRPCREVQRVNVDSPIDLLRAIDREAKRIGVTRQAFIKLRLADTVASLR